MRGALWAPVGHRAMPGDASASKTEDVLHHSHENGLFRLICGRVPRPTGLELPVTRTSGSHPAAVLVVPGAGLSVAAERGFVRVVLGGRHRFCGGRGSRRDDEGCGGEGQDTYCALDHGLVTIRPSPGFTPPASITPPGLKGHNDPSPRSGDGAYRLSRDEGVGFGSPSRG